LLGGDNEDSPDVAHNNVDVLGHWWKLKIEDKIFCNLWVGFS
jgi:hypothetical protein